MKMRLNTSTDIYLLKWLFLFKLTYFDGLILYCWNTNQEYGPGFSIVLANNRRNCRSSVADKT